MRGSIETRHMGKIPLKEINNFYPFALLKSSIEFIKVCNELAQLYSSNLSELERLVLTNLIAQNSREARVLAALKDIYLKGDLIHVSSPDIGTEQLSIIGISADRAQLHTQQKIFNRKEILLKCWKKYFINRSFRSLRVRGLEANQIVRSWVDVDKMLHRKEIGDSLVFIYPFGINVSRSLKFIHCCYKDGLLFSLMGVPYSFKRLLAITFSMQSDFTTCYVKYECEAYKEHSRDFACAKSIYTSDEFIPASIALYNNLRNTEIINRAHGIGVYNPHISYTLFEVFNLTQKRFYEQFNRTKMVITTEPRSPRKIRVKRLVYIDQGDLLKLGYPCENNIQIKVLETLNEIASSISNQVAIKFHPNRNSSSKKAILSLFKGMVEVKNFTENERDNLFINLYSTAYFDYTRYGNFIFVETSYFNPSILFGEAITKVSMVDLKRYVVNDIIYD